MMNTKLLLVEDDQIDQLAFKRWLKANNFNYDVAIANSIAQAQILLQEENFDVAILDYHLGDGTAFDILELILGKEISAIFLTGAGNEEIAVKAIKLGACDYLVKDVDREYLKHLSTVIDNAMQQNQLMRAQKQFTQILLVEDDVVDQMAFKRLVQETKLSYKYNVVSSVQSAQELLKTEFFNVIISDDNLGDGTVFDILDLVANRYPVIVSTASGTEEIALKAMKAGAYDYLIKDPDRNYLKVLPHKVANAVQRQVREARFRFLFEQMAVGVAQFNIDGEWLLINKKICQILDYTQTELLQYNYKSIIYLLNNF